MLTTTLSPCAALAAFALPADQVELKFDPEVGTKRVTHVAVSVELEGGDLTCVMDGQDVPVQFLPELSFTYQTSADVRVTDAFEETPDDARGPWRIRTVEDAKQAFAMELDMGEAYGTDPITYDATATSNLEGVPFALGRDEDGEPLARWVEDEHPDDALLDNLRPTLDLAALLPNEPAAIRESWQVDANTLADLLEPGGDLAWDWGESRSGESSPVTEYEGTLELTLVEVNDEGIARIRVDGEFDEIQTRETTLDEVPVVDGTATEVTTTSFLAEGELRWDVNASAAASLELKATGSGTAVTTKDEDQPGPTYESTTRHESELSLTLTAE